MITIPVHTFLIAPNDGYLPHMPKKDISNILLQMLLNKKTRVIKYDTPNVYNAVECTNKFSLTRGALSFSSSIHLYLGADIALWNEGYVGNKTVYINIKEYPRGYEKLNLKILTYSTQDKNIARFLFLFRLKFTDVYSRWVNFRYR